MPRSAKRRFSLVVEGKDREVLSAFERPNGDLLLSLKSAALFEDKTPIKYQRYSIHRSLLSEPPIATVKHSLGLEDGRVIETAQARSKSPEPFSTLLYVRVCPLLAIDRYELANRPDDQVLRLYPSEIGDCTPVIAVAAAAAGTADNLLGLTGLSVTRSTFSHFDVEVGVGFFPVPAIPYGSINHLMTSPRRIDGVSVPGPGEGPVDLTSLTPEQIAQWVEGSIKASAQEVIAQIPIIFPEIDTETLARAREGYQVVLPRPPSN